MIERPPRRQFVHVSPARVTDDMIERASRAYVRGIQETFDDGVPDYASDDWRAFEDANWRSQILPVRKALEAALKGTPNG